MRLALLGDSLTKGLWLTKNLSQRLAEKYLEMDVVNFGVPTETTDEIEARMSDVDAVDPFRVWVWGGINDIWASASAATIEGYLQSMYTHFSGQGIEVWALTITPRDDFTGAMNTVRDDVNYWIQNTATGITRIIDAFTIIADPTNTDVRLPAYAVPVTAHFNDAGFSAIVAAIDE